MTNQSKQKKNKLTMTFKYSTILALFLLITFSSCTSRKKILYLQDVAKDSIEVYKADVNEHKIAIGDILYIGIQSMNSKLIEMFAKEKSNNAYNMWDGGGNLYVYGYSVDNNGHVLIPNIGKIFVLNQTIDKAQEIIEKEVRNFVTDASVSVKLLNFNFTLIGEVSRPGTYTNYSNKINIFQAIGYGGDINIFGNKKKVHLIREYPDGKKVHSIDLTNASILNSEFYYLKPNDVVYIEPVSNKSFRQNLPNISVIFSSISTLVLVLNFINKK